MTQILRLYTNVPGIYDNVPATVTYPDGSVDTNVPETIIVGNVVDVTNNGNHNDPSVPNAIPDGYELVTVNAKHGHFGTDTTATTKKYLVKDGTSTDEFVKAIDAQANKGYAQKPEAWDPTLPATFGKADMNQSYNVSFQAIKDSTLYQPSYTGQTMKPSDSKDVPVAYNPSADGKINVGGKAPAGTKYTVDNAGLPAGMTATVTDDGTVTITTVNTPEGVANIPVTVTYPDTSSETVYVPVYVTDGKADQTVTWGDNGAVVTTVNTDKLGAHETSDHSQVLNAAVAVTAVGYQMKDGQLSTTATPITIDPSTVSWNSTPNTNVDTATAAGKKIENQSIKVDLTNNQDAKNILGAKDGVVTTAPFTIDAKGAGAKTNVTTPVDVQLGSDLTDAQFQGLVDNKIPTDEIASTTWATKPDKDGNGGVIKITFTDKDKDGNPTYLNINIPASSLNMTPATAPTDQTPTYPNDTKVKQGDTTTITPTIPAGETPTFTKGDTSNLPKDMGVTVDPKTGVITVTTKGETSTGKTTIPVVITQNGKDTTVNVPVEVDPANSTPSNPGDGGNTPTPTPTPGDTDADKYTPAVTPITTDPGKLPSASDGISNMPGSGAKDSLPDGTTVDWNDPAGAQQTIDNANPGDTVNIPATVEYPDGSKDTVTIPVTINQPQTNPSDADKNTPITQPIDTKPGVLPQNPADGIQNIGDLPSGTTVTWDNTGDAQKQIDNAKPGDTVNIPATVTYPDGSKDQVTIPVVIMQPEDNGENTGANTGNGNGTGNTGDNTNLGNGMNGQATGNNKLTGNGQLIKPTANQTATAKKAEANKLPQTGNQAEKATAVAGMAMLTAALGLFGLKKKED